MNNEERITFEQFIKTFNFRDYAGYSNEYKKDIYDTKIVRIYLPYEYDEHNDNEWFEFGVYDFSEKENTWEICKKIFNDEILKSYVSSIGYNFYDSELALEISLSKEKNLDYE